MVITFGKAVSNIFFYTGIFFNISIFLCYIYWWRNWIRWNALAGWEEITFPIGSTGACWGRWRGFQMPQGVYWQGQKSKLGQEHHKPAGGSREQHTAGPQRLQLPGFQRGILKVCCHSESHWCNRNKDGKRGPVFKDSADCSLNTFLESPDNSVFPKIRSFHEVKY